MVGNSKPSIQIDLNEFKLHLQLKGRPQFTLHFNSPSRSFYLSVIALAVNEVKKSGRIKSIPLQEHVDLLALLNETIGGAAGSSETENLLHRIYTKWRDALPNLEDAPLFKVEGKKKKVEEDGANGRVYSFTDAEICSRRPRPGSRSGAELVDDSGGLGRCPFASQDKMTPAGSRLFKGRERKGTEGK